jgi:hypothetical protein
MKLTQLFLDELDREAPRTRRALEHVPLGRDDWKPHPKSMPLGRLAGLVASMPSWVTLIIESATQRSNGSGNLRTICGRSAICLTSRRREYQWRTAADDVIAFVEGVSPPRSGNGSACAFALGS